MVVDWREHITTSPDMHGGRPTVRGMRIEVQDIIDSLADGLTADEIVADFPELTREDILACLAYASDRLRATA